MAWLELNFGGNSSVRPRTGNNKDYYYWVIYGHKAKDFLKQILPYLKLKQRQAEIAIEFQSNIFAGRNQHNSYTESELAIKEAQVILMHQLNKKGKECVNVSS